jgi:hypothetical protein
VVEPEEVAGVVAPLELDEPVVVRAVGGANSLLGLIVTELVEPAADGEVRLHRRKRLAAR